MVKAEPVSSSDLTGSALTIKGHGVGRAVLGYLELEAAALGFTQAWLSTRRVNMVAVSFYVRHGYVERANYGAYVGRSEAICFEKKIA